MERLYLSELSDTKKVSQLPFLSSETWDEYLEEKINIETLYGTKLISVFEKDVVTGLKHKIKAIDKNYIMNNKEYKLSSLDLEIIKSIPPGGNWKYIPQKTINKSKRLLGIQKTGGRTTLYGRLLYNEPSFTITTYFNRPGNGTYIHPVEDRVITTREGSRLQGFKDNYYFFGNQRNVLNQIGNAVPPFIAYLFSKKLQKVLNAKTSVDLFSGAGGLLAGLEASGIKTLVANDIDEKACTTLKINHPNVNVIVGDITQENIKESIIQNAKNRVDVICGGPPCQGFSLSGFRKNDDPRNQLFREFVNIVKEIKPKAIIFENVVGILSSNRGKAFLEIKDLFASLGYNLEAKTLNFSDYGIPQKRKRVILVGVEKEIGISPLEIFPEKITEELETKITVGMAIKDLEGIEHTESVVYPESADNPYLNYIKGIIDEEKYLEILNSAKENIAVGQQISFDY